MAELELFGSVLRPDFGPTSDIDILVTFLPEADWGLIEHAVMEQELSDLFGRPVDLLTRRAVECSTNPLRRASILTNAVSLVRLARATVERDRVRA